ncbi:MAG: hypothetical protein JXJ04_02285 [Spirochaetales bacterium]|nr:hypothetical protein [Spirochaetales bacterium]
MRKKFIVLSILTALFTLLICHGYAQENIISIPRQLSLFLVFKGDFTQEEYFLLKETLLIKLAEDKDINLVEPVTLEEMSPEKRNIKAGELGADCWLAANVTADPETIKIVYSSYDLINKKFIINEKSYKKSRKIRSLDKSFWKEIIIDIGKEYSQITGKLEVKEVVEYTTDTKDAIEQKGVKVVIQAIPGTRIYGLTDTPIIADTRGIAKTELAQLTTYEIEAVCSGYYPVEQNFYVEYEPVKITLQQIPGSKIAFDIYLHQADYLGAGCLYYIIPNNFYVELSATTYLKKLIWPVEENIEEWEAPLLPVYFTSGFYVNPADSFFRYGFNFGFFIRFVYLDGIGVTIDPISRWGFKIFGFHAEVSGFNKIRFFYEHNVLVYYTDTPELMKAALIGGPDSDSGSPPGYIFGNSHVLDFLDIKVGIRIIL